VQNQIKTFFVCFALALVASCLSALLANHIGILFLGMDTFFVIFAGTIVSLVSVLITKWIFKRKGKQFSNSLLIVETILVSLVIVNSLSWFQTRSYLKFFVNPIPNSVHLHQGTTIMFATFVHFSAPPEVVVKIIQSHQLLAVTNDSPEQIEQKQWETLLGGWWQPAAMSNPKFFMRHHQDFTIQGWTEMLWVNEATNEVFAVTSR